MPTDWASLFRATSLTMAIGSILVWIFTLFSDPHGVSIMHRAAWWSVVYIGLLPQAIGLAVLNWLAFRLNHIQLGVSLIGTPVFVIIGGVTLLNEPSSRRLWAALVLVIIGMVLASRNQSKSDISVKKCSKIRDQGECPPPFNRHCSALLPVNSVTRELLKCMFIHFLFVSVAFCDGFERNLFP